MRPRSFVTIGAGSLVLLFAGIMTATTWESPNGNAQPLPDAVDAATVSVPPPPAVAPPLGEQAVQPLQGLPMSGPTPTLVDIRTSPVTGGGVVSVEETTAVVGEAEIAVSASSTALGRPVAEGGPATGIASASVFSAPRTSVARPGPGIVVLRSEVEARALLGEALPDWVRLAEYPSQAVVLNILSGASERMGCSVLRMQWSRADAVLSVVPLTGCVSGSDGDSGGATALDPTAYRIAGFVLPRALVDGVTRTTSP